MKLKQFIDFILRRKPKKGRIITFLIIGGVGCGKTALIYYMYAYILKELMGKDEPLPFDVPTGVDPEIEEIKQVELRDFVEEIQRVTKGSRDFLGTGVGTINYINYRLKGTIIRIYNISGEIFKMKDSNLLDALFMHLEGVNVQDTFCLLCKAFKDTTNKEEVPYINTHMIQASVKPEMRAWSILQNMIRGVNTLRVVTKFDDHFKLKDPGFDSGSINNDSLNLMSHTLYELNDITNKRKQYDSIFDLSKNFEKFHGSGKIELTKCFTCTGMYSKNDPTAPIFENEIYEGVERLVLKKQYRGENLDQLGMYGVEEIFNFALKPEKSLKKRMIKTSRNAITKRDYKTIFGLKS